jgi:hypothetical protein
LVLALALAAALLPIGAGAQTPAGTLKLGWDHCAGDGLVADRSFACDTNSGEDVLVASVVFNDGVDRRVVEAIELHFDFTAAAPLTPSWWGVWSGGCRNGALALNLTSVPAGPTCSPWYGAVDPGGLIWVSSFQWPSPSYSQLHCAAASAVPVTLSAGQELTLCTLRISHSKTVGANACSGCTTPLCIGFGDLVLTHPAPTPDEALVGNVASTVSWQGAHVAGYTPIPKHYDPLHGGVVPYWGDLQCTTGPVPARNRTWGVIKTLYR